MENCKHEPTRQSAWFARDATVAGGQVLCVACNDCGAVLFTGPIFTKYHASNPVVSPAVAQRLTAMNRFYGRGDVARIEFWRTEGAGYVTCKLQYGVTRRKFTLKGDTLTFLGRKRKLLPCEMM